VGLLTLVINCVIILPAMLGLLEINQLIMEDNKIEKDQHERVWKKYIPLA